MRRRENPSGTEAENLLQPAFWESYTQLAGKAGENDLCRVSECFTTKFQSLLFTYVSAEIASTPLLLTDTLPSDPTNAFLSCATFDLDSPHYAEILINTNYLLDPGDLIYVLLEEVIHIHQYLRGDLFDDSLSYELRPHEIEAKRLAEEIAGFPRPHAVTKLLRVRP